MADHCGLTNKENLSELLDHFDEGYHPLVKLAKVAGIEAVQALLDEIGGTKPHMPTLENFTAILAREVRNEDIRLRFNHGIRTSGSAKETYQQLELDTGLHERQLREIIHSKARSYQRHNEPTKTIKVSDEHHERLELLVDDYGADSIRAITDAVLTAALEHKDIHAALRKAFGGEQMRIEMGEAA